MKETQRITGASSGLSRFRLLSLLLVGIPLPFAIALQYLGGGLDDAAILLVGWIALAVVYWWPVGTLLFRWKRGWPSRLIAGYLLSVPLYVLGLAVVYPAFGVRFRPRDTATWGIYFGATPTFYLLVVLLFFLTRGMRTGTRITTWLIAAGFAAGVLAPIVVAVRTDRYLWPGATTSQRTVIVNVRIVDAAADRIIDGKHVRIDDGRISAIVEDVPDETGEWRQVDAGGHYLLPGLIDVHTHLETPIRSLLAPFDFGYFLQSLFSDYAPQRRAYLEAGVTSVRDLGGPAAHAYRLRSALLRHAILGPRLAVVGRLVTSPHGHPVGTIWTSQISRQGAILASDSHSLISGLERNYAAGPPDGVKLIYGTIGRAKERLTRELLEEGIAWAKAKGLPSIVHAETTREVVDAAAAGAADIEHVASIEQLPDDLVALLVDKQIFVDPTFGEFETAMILRHVDEAERSSSLRQKYRFLRRLHEAGVRLTVGTDAPLVPFGTGYHDEIAHYSQAGFRPAEILTFATRNNAACLGRSEAVGGIEPGSHADLVLVADDPLRNLETLRRPLWVMLDGRIVVPGSLKK
jgi:imidazolonepropionase-like amidohydrolase